MSPWNGKVSQSIAHKKVSLLLPRPFARDRSVDRAQDGPSPAGAAGGDGPRGQPPSPRCRQRPPTPEPPPARRRAVYIQMTSSVLLGVREGEKPKHRKSRCRQPGLCGGSTGGSTPGSVVCSWGRGGERGAQRELGPEAAPATPVSPPTARQLGGGAVSPGPPAEESDAQTSAETVPGGGSVGDSRAECLFRDRWPFLPLPELGGTGVHLSL